MITYNTEEDPTERGVYACRVPHELPGLYKDEFLMWMDGKWGYLGNDQGYRGEVTGWIGPLQRKMTLAGTAKTHPSAHSAVFGSKPNNDG